MSRVEFNIHIEKVCNTIRFYPQHPREFFEIKMLNILIFAINPSTGLKKEEILL